MKWTPLHPGTGDVLTVIAKDSSAARTTVLVLTLNKSTEATIGAIHRVEDNATRPYSLRIPGERRVSYRTFGRAFDAATQMVMDVYLERRRSHYLMTTIDMLREENMSKEDK
jgi:transcriptional regulator GlxA family with amidase domain